jgi:hypothetical protein
LLLLKAAPSTKPAEKGPARKLQPKWKNCSQTLQVPQEELRLLKEELAKHGKQIEEARASEATVKATEAATTSTEVKSTNPRAQYANDQKHISSNPLFAKALASLRHCFGFLTNSPLLVTLP